VPKEIKKSKLVLGKEQLLARFHLVMSAYNNQVRCPLNSWCQELILLRTSSKVPLKGPGVSILIEARVAANFNDSSTP
jgi:hypothetical protein